MNPKRAEPFLVALTSLRGGLREGAFGVEARLAATEIAEQLRLSPTPVREALARLAGEGLVEDRRGQGYFVRRPSAIDIADLYRLGLAYLSLALEPRVLHPRELEHEAAGAGAVPAVARIDRLFEGWVAEAGGWVLAEGYARLQARLAPIRLREPLLISDLEAEARGLVDLEAPERRSERLAAVRAFHRRRVRLAPQLAGLLERRPASGAYPGSEPAPRI